MTNKERIRAIIKQYADRGERLYNESYNAKKDSQAIGYWDGYRDCANLLLRELDDMQEEPTSVWHDAIEVPEIDRTILLVAINGNSSLALWDGKSLRSCTLGGGHSVFCKNDKWCYIDELIKL